MEINWGPRDTSWLDLPIVPSQHHHTSKWESIKFYKAGSQFYSLPFWYKFPFCIYNACQPYSEMFSLQKSIKQQNKRKQTPPLCSDCSVFPSAFTPDSLPPQHTGQTGNLVSLGILCRSNHHNSNNQMCWELSHHRDNELYFHYWLNY